MKLRWLQPPCPGCPDGRLEEGPAGPRAEALPGDEESQNHSCVRDTGLDSGQEANAVRSRGRSGAVCALPGFRLLPGICVSMLQCRFECPPGGNRTGAETLMEDRAYGFGQPWTLRAFGERARGWKILLSGSQIEKKKF